MNKVVNINLNGLVFSIEEIAYEQLKSYLDGLKKHFEGTEGASEIIADIEARIAELLQLKITDKYSVIQLSDVKEVIGLMGDPREMDGEEEPQMNTKTDYSYKPKQLRRDANHKTLGGVCAGLANYFGVDIMIPRVLFLIAFFAFGTGLLAYFIMWVIIPESNSFDAYDQQATVKRLFRNPEDKKLGGVCSGAALYLGIDTVWLRLAFLIALFVFGTGFLAYIILWIAIPLAKTSAEKLQMKGENIDVNNIEKVVRNTLGKSEAQIKKGIDTASQNLNQAGNTLTEMVRVLVKLVGKLVGAFLLILSLLIIGSVLFLWNYSFADTLAQLDVTSYYSYFQYGFGLFTFSIAALIMLIGIKIMFHAHIKIKLAAVILITAAIVGVGLLINFGLLYKESVSEKAKIKMPVVSAICPDTLYIKSNTQIDEDESEEVTIQSTNKFKLAYTKDLIKVFYNTHLSIKPNNTDSLQLNIIKTARGESDKKAMDNASNIQFQYSIVGNTLFVDPGIMLASNAAFKFQQLFAKLRIPVGTIIIVDKQIMKMINTSYEEDFDLGETFKMTSKGLKCLDCVDTEDTDEDVNIEWNMDDENGDMNIHIGKEEKEIDTVTKTNKDGKKIKTIKKIEAGPITIVHKTDDDVNEYK